MQIQGKWWAHRAGMLGIAAVSAAGGCTQSKSPTAPSAAARSPASMSLGAISAEWFADYTIVDLGVLPGGAHSTAVAINDRTEVIGWSSTHLFDGQHAFLWRPGLRALHDLGTLRRADSSLPTGINQEGNIVGLSGGEAVFWDDGFRLHRLPAAANFSPTGINNHDVVVGSAVIGGCGMAATWTWRSHVRGIAPSSSPCCPNPMVPQVSCSFGVGINDNGEVAGTLAPGELFQAFLLDRGNHLRLLIGGSFAAAINRLGHVTGLSSSFDEFGVGFLWTPEHGMRQVGPFPGESQDNPNGMNDHDEIVGWSRAVAAFATCYHPFVWSPKKEMKLLPSLTGFHPGNDNCADETTIPFAINNRGEIVGESSVRSHPEIVHAVLWRPRHPLPVVR